MSYEAEREWEALTEKALQYRRKQIELEEVAADILDLVERLLPGDRSGRLVNQLLGSGNVPVEEWIRLRRAEEGAGLKPGTLPSSKRKKPKQ